MPNIRSVPSRVYTKDYYLHDCSNFNEFNTSGGDVLGDRFKALLPYLQVKPGMKVLDIGSGRGELAFYASSLGAKVIGIDYSKAAVELANQALAQKSASIRSKVKFIHGSINQIKLPPKSFDLIISVEVLEHLYPEEVTLMLQSTLEWLAPNGRFVFHTAPNRWFNDYTYPYFCYPVGSLLIKLSNAFTHSRYPQLENPKLLRTESHQVMHVNEPTYFSLSKAFKQSGLKYKIKSTNVTVNKPIISWKDKLYNLLVFGSPISNYFPFNILWANDFLITSP